MEKVIGFERDSRTWQDQQVGLMDDNDLLPFDRKMDILIC